MALERFDILVSKAREIANATNYSSTHGIRQYFFTTSAENAIIALQRHITLEVPEAFSAWQEENVVAAQEAYAAPTRALARHLIYDVQFSPSGEDTGYYNVTLSYERRQNIAGNPQEYRVEGPYTYLWPIPSSAVGTMRRRYEQQADGVDFPRGIVSSTTGAAPAYATIVLSATDLDTEFLNSSYPYQYLCVCDWYGNIVARNVPITGYNTGTRTFTIKTGYAAGSGESISAGDYVVIGQNKSTHPIAYDSVVGDFLINWMAFEAQNKRSSTDSLVASKLLQTTADQIVEIYQQKPAGRAPIPETREYL